MPSMHEPSLSMPERMLSLSMLFLATYPEAALVLRHADLVRPRTALDAVPRIPHTALNAVSRVPRWTWPPAVTVRTAYRMERGPPRTAYCVGTRPRPREI